jgi:hypothetical protein
MMLVLTCKVATQAKSLSESGDRINAGIQVLREMNCEDRNSSLDR